MAEPHHYLVSFENVVATVGGFDVSSIVEMQLSASSNGIPELTLLVDGSNSGVVGSTEVSTVSLSSVRTIFDNCRSIVRTSSATLSLSLTVREVGESGENTQTLAVSGWLLTDVSFSPVSRGEVCTVALTFRHPICKAHYGGSVPGLLSVPPDLSTLASDNPVSTFIDALRLYCEEAERVEPRDTEVEGASDAATVRDNLIGRLAQATSDLESHVSYTGGGMPASAQLAGWEEYIAAGIADYAYPGAGVSVFQRFVGALLPECSLAMGGDFLADKLTVGPFSPWADASFTLSDRDIAELRLPQADPTPISGVQILSNDTAESIIGSMNVDGSQLDIGPLEVYYVPQSELSAEFLYGPIQQYREPGWLSSAKAAMLNATSTEGADGQSARSGLYKAAVTLSRDETPTLNGGVSDTPDVDYGSAVMACAKAYYETVLMKDWGFAVTTRLLFRSGGKLICPGQVVSVVSDGAEILGGYVTNVTHVISVANRNAHTTITCTHPRFGALPASITSKENALYA